MVYAGSCCILLSEILRAAGRRNKNKKKGYQVNKQVFINLPVSDLARSTAFYEKLGCTKNPDFSDDKGVAMQWSDGIVFMLLTHEFYQQFLQGKTVADTHAVSGVLVALSLDSKEAVQQFADTAKANGGDYFMAKPNEGLDFMFCLEVTDLDGNTLEPVWMNMDFVPEHVEGE